MKLRRFLFTEESIPCVDTLRSLMNTLLYELRNPCPIFHRGFLVETDGLYEYILEEMIYPLSDYDNIYDITVETFHYTVMITLKYLR